MTTDDPIIVKAKIFNRKIYKLYGEFMYEIGVSFLIDDLKQQDYYVKITYSKRRKRYLVWVRSKIDIK